MVLDKSSVHEFETNDVTIQLTEYPFYPGEEVHLKVEPKGEPEYVSLHGNPSNKQTLTLKQGEFYVWIESENLFNSLVRVVEDYKRMWNLNPENAAKVETDD